MRSSKLFFHVLLSMVFLSSLVFSQAQKVLRPSESGKIPGAEPSARTADAALYSPGEVLVKFRRGISMNQVNQIAAAQSLNVKKHFRVLSRVKGQEYVLMSSFGNDTRQLVQQMSKISAVEDASPNYRLFLDAAPNDTYYNDFLWGLNNTGQLGGTVDADIDAPEAWDISTGSSDVIVAVIDTGVDYTSPDLAPNIWVNQDELNGTAGVDDDGNGYVDDVYGIDPAGYIGTDADTDPRDGYGHGTHCAGTIGAVGNNSYGVVGVNWNVKLMGLKMFTDMGSGGLTSWSIECIEYAIDQKLNYNQNIVAINASWGGGGFSQPLKDAIEAAGTAGIVFCAAAGNGGADGVGDDNDTTPHYPSSYTSANIVAVAATDFNDAITTFSNYGATSVDLAAPGQDILSTYPRQYAYAPAAGDIFFDDMESGAGNWTHGGTNDSWAITTDQEGFLNATFPVPSPTQFWSDSPGGNYVLNTDSWLAVAADIDLSSYVGQQIYFGFGAAMYIEGGYDHGYVEFSTDSGATWTPVFDFSGYGNYWDDYHFVIADQFKTSQFRFRFHFTSDSEVEYWGWLIDDVGIGTTNSNVFMFMGGTSMATPHVAGAVALRAAVFPTESVGERIGRIFAGVDVIPSMSGKCVTGGRLNLYNYVSMGLSPGIQVTAPNGGENLTAGSACNITWSSTGSIEFVKIEYSTDNGSAWSEITASTPNDGSYEWDVPASPSMQCLVRISDAIDGDPVDVSDATFTITVVGGILVLSSPNGGESWTLGDYRNITWTASGVSDTLKLTLLKDGSQVGVIASGVDASAGGYAWTVGEYIGGMAVTGSGYTVKIKEQGTAVADESDAAFTITAVSGATFVYDGIWEDGATAGVEGWHPGDYDGDGIIDLLNILINYNKVFVSDGTQFIKLGRWLKSVSGLYGWFPGYFNGDGKTDLMRFTPANDWGPDRTQVFLSTGTAFVKDYIWVYADPGSEGYTVGDFNGDGKDDMLIYDTASLESRVYVSSGSEFLLPSVWFTGHNGMDGWYTGDFNGDGRTDLARTHSENGTVVLLSTGTAFTSAGVWTPALPQAGGWLVADYNGDGMDDLLRGKDDVAGTEVFLSTGTAFQYDGVWSDAPAVSAAWRVGDFSGDTRADLLFYQVSPDRQTEVYLSTPAGSSSGALKATRDANHLNDGIDLSRPVLPQSVEDELMQPWLNKWRCGEEGNFFYRIKREYEEKLGRKVRDNVIYRMLERYRKIDSEKVKMKSGKWDTQRAHE